MSFKKSKARPYHFSALLMCTGCGSTSGSGAPAAPPNPIHAQPTSDAVGAVPDTRIASWSSESTLGNNAPTPKEYQSRHSQSWLGTMRSPYLGIKAPYLSAMGTGDGTGVIVGTLDSGVDKNHPALLGKIDDSKNFVTPGLGNAIPDTFGHGTAVAALMVASLHSPESQIRGVAPGGKLVVGKVGNNGDFPLNLVADGIDWLVDVKKVPIINLSLGTTETLPASAVQTARTTFQNAVQKGTLVVVAAGNDGLTNQVGFPATFANQTWANGQIIVAGALTTDQASGEHPATTPNIRANFSNYDPALAAFTVYAPGVLVTTANSGMIPNSPGSHQRMTGTSASAPIIAGHAAVIKSNWQFLHASNIARIIFKSATRICSDGSSAVVCEARATPDREYGWGIINVAASLRPMGRLNVQTASGAAIRNFAWTSLSTPRSGMASGLRGIQTLAVDDFNRAFKVSLADPHSPTGAPLNALPGAPGSVPSTGTPRFAFPLRSAFGGAVYQGERPQRAGAIELGFNGSATQYFGLSGNFTGWRNPYLGLLGTQNSHDEVSRVMHLGYADRITGWTPQPLTWRVALLGSQPSAQGNAALALGEIASIAGHLEYALSFGQLHEYNSILGLTGGGAMALTTATDTRIVSLSGVYRADPRYALEANVATGYTGATHNHARSLINGTSETQSLAWSLGFKLNQLMSARDSLQVTVSMPLRTQSGVLGYSSADFQDAETGALHFSDKYVNLAPNGSERNLALNYAHTLSRDFESVFSECHLSARIQMQWEPQHLADAAPVLGMGLRLSKFF